MALPNSEKITSQIAMLPDAALKQMAMMHKSDPYVLPLIISEDGRRKQMRQAAQAQMARMPQPRVADAAVDQMGNVDAMGNVTGFARGGHVLPENQGIGQLPAPNMQRMADGGIAGYGDDQEQGMATGGMGGMFNFAQQSEPVVRMSGGGMPGYMPRYKDGDKVVDYRKAIIDEANRQGVPPEVALQISGVESNFDPNAKPIDPKTGKPRSSATSFFQVINETFKNLGGKAEKRNDPMENIRVGVKSLAENQNALTKKLGRQPNPAELYTTHFLGTDTGSRLLSADPNMPVSAFLDKVDPTNKSKILAANPEVLGGKKTVGDVLSWTQSKMAPVLTAAVPARTAQAAEPPKAAPQDLVSQIPGSKVAPRAPGEKERYLTGNEQVIGAGETALQYLTGALAIPTAGGAAVLEQVPNVLSGIFGSGKGANSAEMEKSFREKAGQVTYEPRTVGGKAVSEGFGKTLEDLKIPPYMARIGLGTPKGPAARPSAEGIAGIAEQMKQAAAEQKAAVSTPRLEPPRTEKPKMVVDSEGRAMPEDTRARVATAFDDLSAAEKAARDAAAWEKAAQEAKNAPDFSKYAGVMDEAQTEAARARGISALASVTPSSISAQKAVAPEVPQLGMVPVSPDEFGTAEADMPKPSDVLAATKEAVPAKDRKGFDNEDLLMLGLNLMANKSPQFFTALGESGLQTLSAKKEREKRETDLEYKDIMKDYYGSLGKKAGAEAKNLESGAKYDATARQHAMDNISREMQKWEQSLGGVSATPQQVEAKRLALTKFYFPLAGLEVPSTMSAPAPSAGFKVLGSRPQ
jgi:hypothetical protein